MALISAITVPSLVGLNLSGTGGTVVRWLTFASSLVAAISTGILTLYRVGDRWLMYRKLGSDAETARHRRPSGGRRSLAEVKGELDLRVGQAFASRAQAELAALTADIPAGPLFVPFYFMALAGRRGPDA